MEINHNPFFREAFSKQQHKRLLEEAAKARLLRKAQVQENKPEKKRLDRVNIRNLFLGVIDSLKEIAVWLNRAREIGTESHSSH